MSCNRKRNLHLISLLKERKNKGSDKRRLNLRLFSERGHNRVRHNLEKKAILETEPRLMQKQISNYFVVRIRVNCELHTLALECQLRHRVSYHRRGL